MKLTDIIRSLDTIICLKPVVTKGNKICVNNLEIYMDDLLNY